ncbi:MAG: hypothetical protein M3N54_07375, partial [Acidobacteriota bacterium]|nr:hypothetical protein [Acidobacteriota bacterium]
MRRWQWVLAALAALLLLAVAAGLWVVQSDWLREKIRAEIIQQVEKSTGGKAELGSFRYDWQHLTVQLDRFTIHGTETPGAAPLLAVDRIILHLRIISLLHGDIRIQGIDADRPQAHLIVYPDGRTNIPGSKIDTGEARQKILDLKIARFNVSRGLFTIEGPGQPVHRIPWDAHGEDLIAAMSFDGAAARYSGDIAIADLHVLSLDFRVAATASFEKNRIVVPHASLKTSGSQIELTNAVVNGFRAPVTTGQYDAHVSLAEAARVFGMKYKPTGTVASAGSLRFVSASDYSMAGSLHGTGIDFDQLHNLRVDANFDTNSKKTSVRGARVSVLGGEATGEAETADFETLRASGSLAHFDLRELAKLGTRQPLPYDGLISGSFDVHGRIGRPDVEARLALSPAGQGAPVRGDVAVRFDAGTSKVNLGQSWLELPHTRVEISGTLGDRLNAKLQSTDYKDLVPALDLATGGKVPDLAFKSLAFEGTVAGPVSNPVVSGRASFGEGRYGTHIVESFSGDIAVSRAAATASHAEVVYSGIRARGAGSIGLTKWNAPPGSPITATLEMIGASVTNLLSAAGHKEVEVSGRLNTNARITGTLGAPLAEADVALTKGFIYGQPFDSISGRLQVVNRSAQALTGVFVSGPKRVNITARFEHAGTQFPAGTLEFNLTSNTMPLNQIALVRQRQPDIHGFGKFHADGVLKIGHDGKHEIQFNVASLNADASANEVELGGRNLGDAHFTAQTKDDLMTAHFDSNAARASIRGEATVRLADDYAANGRVTFTNAGLNSLAALIVKESDAASLNFDGTAEGSFTFSGPVRKPGQMVASFEIPHVEIRPLPGAAVEKSLPNFVLSNTSPIRATLANSTIKIESARFKAPETDLMVDGSIGLGADPG